MSINARNKGKAGESEWINRYQPFFPGRQLKRNLEQVRSGGSDILGAEPWVIEVKRCEKLEHNKWWKQVCASVTDLENDIPVVAYRQNRREWRYLIPSAMLGIEDTGFCEVTEDIWLKLVFKMGPDTP